MKRPFRVVGVQQIAIGGTDKAAMNHLWRDLLGLEKLHSHRSESENVEEDVLACGDVEIDLMVPIDPERSPKVHKPPLNHIGLWVDDLQAAVQHLTEAGVRFAPGGIRKGGSGHDVCFIHPKGHDDAPIGGGGVLIELIQAPAGLG